MFVDPFAYIVIRKKIPTNLLYLPWNAPKMPFEHRLESFWLEWYGDRLNTNPNPIETSKLFLTQSYRLLASNVLFHSIDFNIEWCEHIGCGCRHFYSYLLVSLSWKFMLKHFFLLCCVVSVYLVYSLWMPFNVTYRTFVGVWWIKYYHRQPISFKINVSLYWDNSIITWLTLFLREHFIIIYYDVLTLEIYPLYHGTLNEITLNMGEIKIEHVKENTEKGKKKERKNDENQVENILRLPATAINCQSILKVHQLFLQKETKFHSLHIVKCQNQRFMLSILYGNEYQKKKKKKTVT